MPTCGWPPTRPRTAPGTRRTPTGTRTPSPTGAETNFVAYIAVGVWHHYLATGDDTFLDRMWPTVFAAVEFVLQLQQPGGEIGWKREDDGTALKDALLTGSSSIHHALRCALAIAEEREEPQPDWELAVGALRHAIRRTRSGSSTRTATRWTGTTRSWAAR